MRPRCRPLPILGKKSRMEDAVFSIPIYRCSSKLMAVGDMAMMTPNLL